MKIVVLDGYTSNPGDLSWDGLEKLGEFICYDRTPADKIVERIDDADAVLTNKTPIDRAVLDMKPNLKYIGVLATGYNVVDIPATREKGVVVTNIPDYSTPSVAQFVFALLLELCHHVGHHADSVRAGRWTNSVDFCYWDYPLIELQGKTLGLIGFGRIGRNVAKIATAFGMNVLAYNRSVDKSQETGAIKYASLGDVLAKSDIVSLHVPLSDANRGMIDTAAIAKMKDGVMILNTARGPLVNDADMAEALAGGKVAGYAADVATTEPIAADNPLIHAKNCLLTPHIAWAPLAARERLIRIATDNLAAFIAGKPVNVVNG